jgi:PHD/YefM family antitoxin component YafN of YafNO toxin-antitoxin module
MLKEINMLDINRDIDSLTNFKRNTPDFLRQLKETGEPVVLTINGKAELVVQDSASYQKLMEIAERAEELESLRIAIEEMKAGKGRPIEEMFAKMESMLAAARAKKAR